MACNDPSWEWFEERGLRAFPTVGIDDNGHCRCGSGSECSSPGKHPKYPGWWASAGTPEAYERWRPGDNLSVATGRGVVVFDWDGTPTSTRPATLIVATPSGGEHWYFTTDRQVRNGVKVFEGIMDIRGEGGFVVAPPSRHKSGGSYTLVDDLRLAPPPPWAQRVLQRPRPRVVAGLKWPESDPDEESFLVEDMMVGFCGTVLDAPHGMRNSTLFSVACDVSKMVCSGAVNRDRIMDIARAAAQAGLPEGEIKRTIQSAIRSVASS